MIKLHRWRKRAYRTSEQLTETHSRRNWQKAPILLATRRTFTLNWLNSGSSPNFSRCAFTYIYAIVIVWSCNVCAPCSPLNKAGYFFSHRVLCEYTHSEAPDVGRGWEYCNELSDSLPSGIPSLPRPNHVPRPISQNCAAPLWCLNICVIVSI